MQRIIPPLSLISSFVCAVGLLVLTGCGTNFAMPDAASAVAPATSAKSSFGAIQGSNFGGHAPIVGAHVFLLQAGTGGYNAASTSLLGPGETGAADYYGNTFPTAKDTTPGSPTNGDYYVTTDAYGNFNLAGTGYSCTPGLPVYLYAQGGNPETNPTSGFTVTITGASDSDDADNKLLVTFTTTGNQLLYQGEQVVFGTGIPAPYDAFNGTTQTVSALNLTTTTFAVEVGAYTSANGPATFTSTVTQYQPIVSNPAIVNLAVLGVCPEGGPVVNLTGASSSQSGGDLLVTFTNSGTNSLTAGEQVTFGTIPAPYSPFSNTTQTVSAIGLSSTQFAVLLGPGTNQSSASFTSTATPVGNFSSLPYVYMNEVSTAAAAYALGGFFPAPGTSGLANAGAVAANLSIPSGDSLALTGIQNAAITADQIYDILGSVIGVGADGETHIARTSTPGVAVYATTTSGSATVTVGSLVGLLPGVTITGAGIPAGTTISAINSNTITLSNNATATGTNVLLRAGAGNGVVPQTLINTVGNILANCVDSSNTYNPYTATGTATTQCSSLFADALSAGTSGTQPVDTASAAIDIAHNPWANVSALANLPTGNVPFQPYLNSAGGNSATAINDFSVGIEYTPANIGNPEGLAIDAQGRVWYPNASSAYVTTLTPFGAVQYNVFTGGSPDYVAIDGNGNAWFDNKVTESLESINNLGTLVNNLLTGSLLGNEALAVDGVSDTGYVYAGKSGEPGSYGKYNGSGTAVISPLTGTEICMSQGTNAHAATDNANNGYNLWITGESPDDICIVNTNTGANLYTIKINAATGIGSSYQPEFPAIDVNGTGWIPNQNNASVSKVTQAGVLTSIPVSTLNGGFGAAVDGAGNIFVTSRNNNVVTELLGSTSAPVSTTTFYGSGNTDLFSDPLNAQVDLSGNLWITNYRGSRVVELLGVAAPTWEPLSDAAYHNALGSKP